MKSETIVHWWDGMSRNRIVDELIAYLSSDFCGTDYDNVMGAFNALRSPTPDPITGLLPCGCGGKAGFHYSVMLRDNDCYVACGICGEHSKVALCEEKARDAWNTAMGWKGDAE